MYVRRTFRTATAIAPAAAYGDWRPCADSGAIVWSGFIPVAPRSTPAVPIYIRYVAHTHTHARARS